MFQQQNLCIIGSQRSLKTTLIQYYSYFKVVDTQMTVYIVCSEEKFQANTSVFGKIIPVYQEALKQMELKLVKNYEEYLNILAALSYIKNHQYDIFIFDDLHTFVGNQQIEKKLNIMLFLIQQIKPKSKSLEHNVIVCIQDDILEQKINLVNLLRYHNFQIAEIKLNPKLILQQVNVIKIMENYQIQYKQLLMLDAIQAINDKI